jgi:spermidine/putrescine transport system ATP-binding protein
MGEVNLFDIEGAAGGGLKGEGIEINLPADTAPVSVSLAPGVKATLMVRPEFMHFLDNGHVSDFHLSGVIRAEYLLGSRIHYEVERRDGTMVIVEKLREDRFAGRSGDEVLLGWDVENCHIIAEERP